MPGRTCLSRAAHLAFACLLLPGVADASVTLHRGEGKKAFTLKVCGLSQLEVRSGDDTSPGGGVSFRAQRLRLGFYYSSGPIAANLAVDFAKDHRKNPAGLPAMIKCAFVGYRALPSTVVRLGLVKVPVGMKYSLPGWDMAIVERNRLEKGLVLERDLGVLLTWDHSFDGEGEGRQSRDLRLRGQRGGHGIGVDLGVFNPAGRSGAVAWHEGLRGDALAWAARVRLDRGAPLHVEASWGVSGQAGGPGTADYRVFDLGVTSVLARGRLRLDLEYVHGRNVLGIDRFEQRCLTATAAYMFTPRLEGVVRHYAASATRGDDPAIPDTSLGNTYIGLNLYLSPLGTARRILRNHRVQVNWIVASGDDGASWTGRWGYRHDAVVVQWQLRF